MKRLFLLFLMVIPVVNAAAETNATRKKESPWLLTPLLSSGPKLGTSAGGLAGYLYHFDAESPVSTFAVGGTYSTTNSYVTALGANLYFDRDRQRLIAGAAIGKINNEYNDFLGTGAQVSTTGELKAAFVRYLYRVGAYWFVGAQAVSTNYAVVGDDLFSDAFLQFIGLYGFKSNGIGAVVQRDSRDNQNSPETGSSLQIYNLAFRKGLGGDENFDVYTLKYRIYLKNLGANVLALRTDSRWTKDAPVGGYSSINLPGYTMGQYLGPHSSLIEAEERMPIAGAFGVDIAAGVGCLYGEDMSCTDSDNVFPSVSAGISYLIKPEEKMVIRADVGAGKDDNIGFYLKFGQPF